ncbi:hypothetical protein [Metabacillus litoralis]|uniref:hypothetical protein n=1 Tax=Metabacillus litoralis TaxID=152268 RepID=UPI00203CA8C1|nr:hypothetical protein [Metabacillus litoralis]MCM3160851.1 hypothetical protein [Metabacillus litoralis]
MGYILPIQQDTYTQYANRSISVQQHYSQILPTSAIKLNRNNEQEHSQQQQKFANILEEKLKKNKYSSSFTGKGKLFNEYV